MFNTDKTVEITKPEFYRTEQGNDFPIRNYIVDVYNKPPCYFAFNEKFSNEILAFLIEKGIFISSSCTGSLREIINDFRLFDNGHIYFKYKKVYIRLTVRTDVDDDDSPFNRISAKYLIDADLTLAQPVDRSKNSKKNYSLSFYYPSHISDIPFKDFEKFIVEDTAAASVFIFIKNQYGDYSFEPLPVKLPENLDLELNYGKKFLDVDKKVKERLAEKPNGLFMFHGLPGTGKTTYIKYLAKESNRDFIYIPTTMIESFTSDPNCLHTLLQKPNSVIILEDAEKAIMKRQNDGMDSSAVSSLLNLSDGILSDILKTSVILTYNCPKHDIDDALKRKGRLQVEYEFGALSIEDGKKLAKKIKIPKNIIEEKITHPLTLSEIYNLEREVEFYDEDKKPKPKVIGFGN